MSLAMAELASALPEEGGYVAWVRRAFGPFWGFQVGWWSWINSFVDVAVYPALFADYLRFWWPGMSSLERWLFALAFVWILTAINLAGRARSRAGARWRSARARSRRWRSSPSLRALSARGAVAAAGRGRTGAGLPDSGWASP